MSKTKTAAALVLSLLLASFLQAQSLTDLAKKEKERRAALKGKATTVTTEDLAKVKKKPAVEAAPEQPAGEQAAEAGEAGAQPAAEAAPAPEGQPAAPAAGGAAEVGAEAPAAEPEKPAEETPPPADAAERDLDKRQIELADAAQEKAELVDLLTLKMNALYQQLQGVDNMKSREVLQQQISDTYDKLLKAETESAKAGKELEEFLAQRKKGAAPRIWIK